MGIYIGTIDSNGLAMNTIFTLIIFTSCHICLLTVLVCYGLILKTIRDFNNTNGVNFLKCKPTKENKPNVSIRFNCGKKCSTN